MIIFIFLRLLFNTIQDYLILGVLYRNSGSKKIHTRTLDLMFWIVFYKYNYILNIL